MSEYQYYEFAAIDRPLTRAEMDRLRAISTRADITPTGFTNHYEWGDLEASPDDWMRRYWIVDWALDDADMLAVARAGSSRPPRHAAVSDDRDADWLEVWSREEMAAVLQLIAEGKSQTAERQVKNQHSAWPRAHRPKSTAPARPRSVGRLRELAESVAGKRPR